jgi:hypothetical protein
MASEYGQSSIAPYVLCSDDEEYLTSRNLAETTPGRNKHTARLSPNTRLYLNSLPESPNNWVQIDPSQNDYCSDPMEISNTF